MLQRIKNILPHGIVKEKDGLMLYCAAIPVVLYPLLMHKIGVNLSKRAILFIDRNEYSKRTDIDAIHRFKEKGIFEDVVDCKMFVNSEKCSDLKNAIIGHFDKMFFESGYRLEDFDTIYTANDGWGGDINLYLNLKKIRYTWINSTQNYVPTPFTENESMRRLCEEYKSLTPFSEYANPCILVESDKIKLSLSNRKKAYSVWDLKSIYDNIDPSYIEIISGCYLTNELPDTSNAVLIIKNSGAICDNAAFKRFNKSREIVQIVCGRHQYSFDDFTPFFDKIAVDFFSCNAKEIYIKEHPNCPINNVQKEIYNENILMISKIPIEILAKYFKLKNMKFRYIIGYFSTSLSVVDEKICENRYILGDTFFYTSFFYSSIYSSIIYAANCKIKSIFCSEMLKSQLDLLLQTLNFKIDVHTIDFRKIDGYKDSLILLDFVLDNQKAERSFLERVPSTSAVGFFNVELTEDFFDESLMPNFLPIQIKKQKIAEGFLNLHRDETLWIYSRNQAVLKATRFFTMEKILPRCGLRVYVEESTIAAGMELFKERSCQKKVRDLSKQVEILTEIIVKGADESLFEEMLHRETDPCRYIGLLKEKKAKYLIILCVRDTPGNCLPDNAVQAIHEIGFTNFSKELWRMYIGISSLGEVICNLAGESREAPVNYQCNSPRLSVSSMAWRQGNQAEITINGINYSANMRGINIVVYDLHREKVIDSVGFDCHGPQWNVTRRDT